jgi:hypothetical protein
LPVGAPFHTGKCRMPVIGNPTEERLVNLVAAEREVFTVDDSFWLHRQLRRELDRLRNEGVPAAVLATPVNLLRAPKGRALHQNPYCSRLVRTVAPVTVTVDLTTLVDHPDLCPHCLTLWGNPISDALAAARFLVSARERFRERPAVVPFGTVLSLRSDSMRARDLAKTAHPDLAQLLAAHSQAVDAVTQQYSANDIDNGRKTALHHRCIREQMARPGTVPSYRREHLAPLAGNRSHTARSVIEAAWSAWGFALDRGVDPHVAACEAVAAGVAKAGSRPPANWRKAGTSHSSQLALLTAARKRADWTAARDAALNAVVATWTQALTTAFEASVATPHVLHLRGYHRSSLSVGPHSLAEIVLDLYEAFRHRDEWLVTVPAAVACQAAKSGSGAPGYRAETVWDLGPAEDDDWTVYETAFSLRDSDPERRDLRHHLTVARLVLHKAS